MRYKYVPYKNIYPKLFEEEKRRIKSFLSKDCVIEHFGSTSIKGVGGKGIIDIYVSIDESLLDQTSNVLQSLGYERKDTNLGRASQQRIFHQIKRPDSTGELRKFHLHLGVLDSEDFKKSIAFRDYLRTHPEFAAEYDQIKRKSVKAAKSVKTKEEKKRAYMETKQPMIDKILKAVKKL